MFAGDRDRLEDKSLRTVRGSFRADRQAIILLKRSTTFAGRKGFLGKTAPGGSCAFSMSR